MWGSYSTCPVTCGGGTQIKTRTKLVVEDHGGTCSGLSHQDQLCNKDPCPGITHKWEYAMLLGFQLIQGGLQNGALTQQFAEWKKYNLGEQTWGPNYTPGVNYLDHDFL